MPNKYFSIDGVATYVHHQGRTTLPEVAPDLSRGETLLCLHGAGGNGGQFEPLAAQLADTHSPIAFDQPGHGRSGGLDSLGDIERMAEFTRAFANKLGLPPQVLVGHSMGGLVALQMALLGGQELRALVLVGSGAHLSLSDEAIEQFRLVTEGKARRQFVKEVYSPKAAPDVMRQGFMEEIKTDPRSQYADLLACLRLDLSERLSEVALPVLVVRGADELPWVEEQQAPLLDRLPNAKGVVIPDAGHMLPIEQPEALAAAINEFLAEVLQ